MNPTSYDVGPDGGLTPYADALRTVLDNCRPLGRETLPLGKAAGRYLAEAVKARFDAPRFTSSSMDGFAVRAADLATASGMTPISLEIIGEIPAGSARRLTLGPGQAARVFTGGRLPRGADAVVMVEHVTVTGMSAEFTAGVSRGNHIRHKGEEYRKGEEILPAGLRVTPPVIGVLASQGLERVAVGRVPAVVVITMGDELLAPGEKPSPGRIHDACGPALIAALRGLGLRRISHRRVGDNPAALKQSLAAALRRGDAVITVGGASVGDHDHTAVAREAVGVRTLFSRMAVKPGKPNMFGLGPGRVPVFSLPGNPVSALVGFHQLVAPGLRAMMGCAAPENTTLPAVLATQARTQPGRLEWLRALLGVRDKGLVADPVTGQESHMLSGLAKADALAEIPRDAGHLGEGAQVRVIPLDWDR